MGERSLIDGARTDGAMAEARALAEQGLAFVAADPQLVGALLDASGADPAALRRMVAAPEFPGFMLDFLMADDARVLAFAAEAGIAPETLSRLKARLDAAGSGRF